MWSIETETPSDTLMRQAPTTVAQYAADLRREFGHEWCRDNPQAFATLIHAAALDFAGCLLVREIGRLRQTVEALGPYLDGDNEP